MLPPRDVEILRAVAHYDTLTRAQVNRLLFPNDHNGRITRKRLAVLLELGLVNQTSMRVVNPAVNAGVSAPVYYPSAKGAEFLNGGPSDGPERPPLNTTSPNWMFLYHFVEVAETHIALDAAVKLRPDVIVSAWYGERSILDTHAKEPEKHYRLYELVSDPVAPRVVCVPDAAFLLAKDGHRKVFYLEQDRDTTKSAERVAAAKCGGYAGLFAKQLHRSAFPETNVEKFMVLMLAPTARRRDALRAAISKRPGADLWRFAALTDLKPETFLAAPIWYPCEGEAKALVKGGPG
jgi:Replication-relaxation